MTDAELIQLLQEKSPRDLTAEELDLLRRRWTESEELRRALADQLQLETDLYAALSPIDLSVDRVLARSGAIGPQGKSSSLRWWGLIGLCGMALVAVTWWVIRPGDQPAGEVVATRSVDETTTAKDAESSPKETPPDAVVEPSTEVTTAATTPTDANVPAVVEAVKPKPPEEPWSRWLQPDAQPLAADSPQWQTDLASMGHDESTDTEARRWWTEVPGQPLQWNTDQVGGRRTLRFGGWAELRAPWLADAALRLTPFDVQELQLFFWNGDNGIALRYYRHRDPHVWAAFAVTRQPGQVAPQTWGLLTTDSGAFFRSRSATLEVRQQPGELVLSTGGIPLLRVPTAQAATQVLMHGQSRFRGWSWLRAAPLQAEKPPEPTLVLGAQPPSEWDWRAPSDGTAMFQRDADGGVTLTSSAKAEPVFVPVILPRAGLFEVLVQVAAAEPGTGIFLGDETGRPQQLLSFFKDRRTQRLTFGALRPNERHVESEFDVNAFPPPYFVPGTWQRLVAGLGTLQISTCADGRQFGAVVDNPIRDLPGAVRSVGLFCLPGETPRTIRLQQLQVRALSHIEQLANPAILARIPESDRKPPSQFAAWLQQTLDHLPADVTPAEWITAASLHTLQRGPSRELAGELLTRLAQQPVQQDSPLDARIRELDEMVSVLDHWHDREAQSWIERYCDLLGHRETDSALTQSVWTAAVRAPLWTNRSIDREFHPIAARVMLQTAETQSPQELLRIAQQFQFWIANAHPDTRPQHTAEMVDRLVRWSRALAGDRLAVDAERAGDILPISWRHPLQLQLNKEAYNTRGELQAALTSESFDDACKITQSFHDGAPFGLLPDGTQPELYVSWPVALASAMEQYPGFQAAMRERFGQTALLRVRQAAAAQDQAALQAATLQFFGTSAATEASMWLGDQRLSVGDATRAARHFQRALQSATPAQQADIEPKLMLALGLSGETPATAFPETATVRGLPLRTLVEELQPSSRRREPAPSWSRPTAIPRLWPARYRADIKAKFDGQGGNNAGRGEYRHADAFGRQFAIAVDGQSIYVHNRFQLTAYDRSNGAQRWAAALGSEQGEAHAHRFTPMTPLVLGDRIYVRQLAKSGIELRCLETATGKVLWQTRTAEQAEVLSDPVATTTALLMLTRHRLEDELLEIRWTAIHPASGEVLEERPLLRLRDAWGGEVPTQLAVSGWNVVATLGGTVIGFDRSGEVLWLQRETWLPPKVDPLAENHLVGPPVIAGDRVYVTQPSVRRVRCLQLGTGREIWSRPIPDLQGLLAVTADRVLLQESNQVTALAATTGEPVWSTELEHPLTAAAVVNSMLLVGDQLLRQGEKGWVRLHWLDLNDGRTISTAIVDAEERNDWRFGPLFAVGDQVWCLAGQDFRDPKRDLVQLSPQPGSVPSGGWDDPQLGVWNSATVDERREVHALLPGWQVLSTAKDMVKWQPTDGPNATPLLRTQPRKQDQLRFARTMTSGGQPHQALRLVVGHQPNERWRVEVRVNQATIADELVAADTTSNGWRELRVPFQAPAGQIAFVQVLQKPVDDKPASGLWQAIDVVTP